MRNRIIRVCALLCAAALLFSCTACGSTTKASKDPYADIPASTGGKDIQKTVAADNVFSLNSNSEYSLNPLIATNHSNQLICSLVYDNMVELDNNFEVIPNVITEWTCNETATSWQFKVDTSRTFHDGTPMSGKDLRFSLERAINADRFRGRFASIMGISHSSDTLYVTLGIGNSQFVKLLNIPIVQSGTYGDDRPGGSGPYMYNEEGTQLLAYEGYPGYENLPVDTIYLKEYDTADGVISAFEDSLIDIVVNDPTSYTNLGYASTNEIRTFPTTNMHYVAFNEDTVLGKFAGFRYAMAYAFDRANLADNLLHNNGVAAALPMHPNNELYPEDLADSIRYDLERCKLVLENAGIKDYDEDGKMEYMSGSVQEIELTVIVCSDSSAKVGVVRKFAEDMESIGLTIKIKELSWMNYMNALKAGEFDMYYGEVKLRNDFDMTELLQKDSTLNYMKTQNDGYIPYINEYLGATEAERASKYLSFCNYFVDNSPMIIIGFESQQIISHRGVIKGINANAGNPLYDFKNWEIMLD